MRFLASIDTLAVMVQLGISTVKSIVQLVREGKAEITNGQGAVVLPEDISKLVADVIATAGQVGDAAAGRVAGRHPEP